MSIKYLYIYIIYIYTQWWGRVTDAAEIDITIIPYS